MHHPAMKSPRQSKVRKLWSTTTLIVFDPEAPQRQQGDPLFTALLNRLQMGLMTDNIVQFLNTRVAPRQPQSQPTAQPWMWCNQATPQSPTVLALELLLPMGMITLCFDNNTSSAINNIACREAEAEGRILHSIAGAMLPNGTGYVATCRQNIANAAAAARQEHRLPPVCARLVQGNTQGCHY